MKFLFFLLGTVISMVAAQSNVVGSVPLTLIDGGTDCNGLGRLVEIHADPTGFSGDGGALVGLNGFVLVINADQANLFTSFLPGRNPISWQTVITDHSLVTNSLVVAGWSTDINAPNQSYHLGTLVLTGNQGSVLIGLGNQTQLASRLVTIGNGPDNLNVMLPSDLNVTVPATYNLNLLVGISSWLQMAAEYDLALPGGEIDLLDLAKLINCTP